MPIGLKDSFLWYNIPGWDQFGLAVPAFGDNARSNNQGIRYLVEQTGRSLQSIMWHNDAMLRVPPTLNTIVRVHKLCIRARGIIFGRTVAENELHLEAVHAAPAPEDFLFFPTPYFQVRNPWLKEYCGYVLTALTEAVQHTDNQRPFELTESFSAIYSNYIQRIYIRMCTELLNIDKVTASAKDFTLTAEQLASYKPSEMFTSTELIDTALPEELIPTEDELTPITNGIAASKMPALGRWPSYSGVTGSTGGTATAPAPASFIATKIV